METGDGLVVAPVRHTACQWPSSGLRKEQWEILGAFYASICQAAAPLVLSRPAAGHFPPKQGVTTNLEG